MERLEEVELGIFLDLNAQIVQLLNGRVAGEEVRGTGPERDDLQMSERIDGAGEFYIFLRMYCPLIVPGLITLGLFTFNSNYNNFLWPSIVLAPEQMTFGIVLREFQMVVSDTGALMAGALITCIPTFIIFLCGQKYFMENLAFTGIK